MDNENDAPLTVRITTSDGGGSELFVAVPPDVMSHWLNLSTEQRAELLTAMVEAADEAVWRIANVILAGI